MKTFKKTGLLGVFFLAMLFVGYTVTSPSRVSAESLDNLWKQCVNKVADNFTDPIYDGDCDLQNSSGKFTYGNQMRQTLQDAIYKTDYTKSSPQTTINILSNDQPLVPASNPDAASLSNIGLTTANQYTTNAKRNFWVYGPGLLTKGDSKNYSFLVSKNGDGSLQILALVYNEIQNNKVYAWKIDKAAVGKTADGSACTPTSTDPSCTPTSTGSANEDKSCEAQFDNAFAWAICPAFDLADKAASVFNTFIESQMCFKTGPTSSTGGVVCKGQNNLNDGVHTSWAIFRNIATALLVIVMLVMVLSQAIGSGPFDAYTVRKLLPKMVAAVIIMQLSWVLFKWAIDLSNDAGIAIRDLMSAPFGGADKIQLDHLLGQGFGTHTDGTNDTFAFFAVLAAGAAAFIISIPGLGLLALYAVMALFTAFIVFIFRDLLIVLLIIAAPLALVAWILPGTDKYWKLWSDNFIKLLLMFPMIMALIAAGRIFASITANNTGLMFNPQLAVAHLGPVPVPYFASVTSFVELAIIVAAYFGPYFFLPQTYKWGGMAMGTISKGVKQGVEKGASPAKDYLDWRKGLSPWKLARQQRRARSEHRIKSQFAERLADEGNAGTIKYVRGRFTRGRIYGLSSRKANREIVAEAVRSARAEQAQEAGKDTQGYFDALALDISGRPRGEAISILEDKLSRTHENAEITAILKRMAQYKDVEAIKRARDTLTARGEAWSTYANNGFLYDDFKKLDVQLLQRDNVTIDGFFNATQSIDHNDELLAGQTLEGWHDFWTEATTAKTIRDPATGAMRLETAAEVSTKQARALEAMRRIQESPAGDNLDNKVRDFMASSITAATPPPPPPPPATAPGAVVPPGVNIPPGSRRAEVVGSEEANLQLQIARATRVDPTTGATLTGWEAVPDADLLRIYRFRTGDLKENAATELQKRGRFPTPPTP